MIDYSSLGFKSGLEIHQRLDCRKLFCECYCNPGAVEETQVKNAARLERFFRPVESETGSIDPTAAFEASKQKKIVYYAPREQSCLVECDEEPPHALNRQALEIVLRVAHALNARVVDEVQVMRKQVLDGSAVAGFQRTSLIAVGGYLETSRGRVGIQSVCLEEESAGIIQQGEGETVYSLDRLGIPLIEIATEPTLKDAEHVRETAQKIGALLRSAGGVQRGIGSIRQDLNISIAGGARVEVKGAQELDAVKKIVENEVLRQQKLIELKKKLAKAVPEAKRIKPIEPIDATGVFSEKTDFVFKNKLNNGVKCLGVRLAGFAGLLAIELMPDHRFGTELSGYVQAATGLRGIIHSDEELAKYKISSEEKKALEKKLGMHEGDAFVLVIAPEKQAKQALKVLLERVKQAFIGVPNETRRANGEKAVFLRPLPGSARMYPETDVTPIKITRELLEKTRVEIESSEEKTIRFQKMGLSQQIAVKMSGASTQQIDWFEKLAVKHPPLAAYAAAVLLETLTALKRSGVRIENITLTHLIELFGLLAENKIAKPAVEEALKRLAQNPSKTAGQVIGEEKLWKKTKREIHELAKSGKAFGELMREHRLTVDAQELQEALKNK